MSGAKKQAVRGRRIVVERGRDAGENGAERGEDGADASDLI